jgi:hypothetical protein
LSISPVEFPLKFLQFLTGKDSLSPFIFRNRTSKLSTTEVQYYFIHGIQPESFKTLLLASLAYVYLSAFAVNPVSVAPVLPARSCTICTKHDIPLSNSGNCHPTESSECQVQQKKLASSPPRMGWENSTGLMLL